MNKSVLNQKVTELKKEPAQSAGGVDGGVGGGGVCVGGVKYTNCISTLGSDLSTTSVLFMTLNTKW